MTNRREIARIGKKRWLCWICFLVGGVFGMAQQPENAIALLKARLTAGTGTWAVRIDGIHAVTSGSIPQMIVRVVNGQVQARPSAQSLRGPGDIVLPVGAIVRVTDIEVVNQQTIDALRLRLTASNGGRAAVAILLAKGSLEGMSEGTLESMVGAVLQADTRAAPGPRVVARDESPTQKPPSPTPQWRMRPVQHDNQKGMEALLAGSATAGGRSQAALLAVSCTKGVSPDAYPRVAASANVQVRPEILTFDTGHMENKAAFHNNAGRSLLGQMPEIHIDIDAQTTDKGVLEFGLGYDEPDLKEIIQAAGSKVKITMMPETPGKGSPVVAEFHLPPNGAAVQSMMSSCFEVLEAQEKSERAKDVVSCPVVAGKVLKDMKVFIGAGGKELETDPESDQIRSWILPKATKARPKLALACFYGEPGYRTDPKEVLEKRVLPISASATGCVIANDSTENRNHGECTRP